VHNRLWPIYFGGIAVIGGGGDTKSPVSPGPREKSIGRNQNIAKKSANVKKLAYNIVL